MAAAGDQGAAAKPLWSAGPHGVNELKSAPVALIPYPRKTGWIAGAELELAGKVAISFPPEFGTAGDALTSALASGGAEVMTNPGGPASIRLVKIADASAESYQIDVTRDHCEVRAGDAAGAYWAVMTLRQMIRRDQAVLRIPAGSITDSPAFPMRGFMLDTARNFQTVETLKRMIERLAEYKINVFHWHLTDNPAWRIESRIYPQLNDPKFRTPGRNPEMTYTFAQIREVIQHAAKHHVMIIPELDMPGHSAYFDRTFGFGMATPQGMEILEKLIDEFCAEIPLESCPYLHLGADEVHIKDPVGFIRRMTAKARANRRTPVFWRPGLNPVEDDSLVQIWGDNGYDMDIAKFKNPVIDSGGGYLNSIDAQWLPQRYFFWQTCRRPDSSPRHPGGILCLWPDVRVENKDRIFMHSPMWPTVLAFSEAIWQGRSHAAQPLMEQTPPRGSQAWTFLSEFESRMTDHRDRYFSGEPFPWIKQGLIEWQVSEAFPHKKGMPWNQPFAPELESATDSVAWKPLSGTTARVPRKGRPVPSTTYLRTWFHSDTVRTAHFMIGFDTPARSHRRSGGIPQQGEWDANGGTIWINGKTPPPPVWKSPGMHRHEKPNWGQPPTEIPFDDEEFYWCREPVEVVLQKGANLVLIRLPLTHEHQSLQATCAPVKKSGGRWVEDESLTNSPRP